MSGRVIQGFFVGAPARLSAGRKHPAARMAHTAHAGRNPGPPAAAFVGRANHAAQCFGGADSFEIDPVHIGLARSGGQRLPQTVLAKMEAAFGADFSAIRVHVGPQASRIGAVAFAMGDDLYFAPGRFQPDSVQGQQLIGHELAHVVQQRQGRVRARGPGVAVVQDPALEAEADRLGARAAIQAGRPQAKFERVIPAASRPRLPLGQQPAVQRALKKWLAEITASDLPPGIELRKDFGGGFRTGYSAETQMLGVYDRNAKLIAHVQIQTNPNDHIVILHTRTDSGVEGGQGYLGFLFGDVLKIIRRDFYHDDGEIWMAPASGAATKGLISQLARLRQRVDGPQRNMFSGVRHQMGGKFLETADALRTGRRKTAKGKEKIDAQVWNNEAMLETAWELNAIAEFERASPSGLQIIGYGEGFSEELVGANAPALLGGALAWHKVGKVGSPALMQLKFPMAAIDRYINALPS